MQVLLDQVLWLPKSSTEAKAAIHSLQCTADTILGTTPGFSSTGEYITVPRHCLDESLPDISPLYVGPTDFPGISVEADIQPWGETEEVIGVQRAAMDFLEDVRSDSNPTGGDSIINLKCGYGKTYIALREAFGSGRHTLIAAHTKDILNNWRQDLVSVCPGAPIGDVISGSFNPQEFTLALIPSLLALDPQKLDVLRQRFGTVIVDEMHHLGARQFSKVGNMFPGRRIGLSATLAREDMMSWQYFMSFGRRIFQTSVSRRKADVSIQAIRVTDLELPKNHARLTTALAESDQYMSVLTDEIKSGYLRGEKQLILSSRKAVLYELSKRLDDVPHGVAVRETKPEERHRIISEEPVSLFIMPFGVEGLSQPRLTTLRVVTPIKDRNSLTQIVGRLERDAYKPQMKAILYAPLEQRLLSTISKAKTSLARSGYYIKHEETI